jgi:hypothetical protein
VVVMNKQDVRVALLSIPGIETVLFPRPGVVLILVNRTATTVTVEEAKVCLPVGTALDVWHSSLIEFKDGATVSDLRTLLALLPDDHKCIIGTDYGTSEVLRNVGVYEHDLVFSS